MTFLDTGFLFALVSKKDAHHARVVEVFRTFRNLRLVDHLLTTDHVVAETITLTLKVGHTEAARIGEQLHAERLARIHWASPEEERAAFAYFRRHQDQTYSFVDCLSFVVMQKLGISEALAVDSLLRSLFHMLPARERSTRSARRREPIFAPPVVDCSDLSVGLGGGGDR